MCSYFQSNFSLPFLLLLSIDEKKLFVRFISHTIIFARRITTCDEQHKTIVSWRSDELRVLRMRLFSIHMHCIIITQDFDVSRLNNNNKKKKPQFPIFVEIFFPLLFLCGFDLVLQFTMLYAVFFFFFCESVKPLPFVVVRIVVQRINNLIVSADQSGKITPLIICATVSSVCMDVALATNSLQFGFSWLKEKYGFRMPGKLSLFTRWMWRHNWFEFPFATENCVVRMKWARVWRDYEGGEIDRFLDFPMGENVASERRGNTTGRR